MEDDDQLFQAARRAAVAALAAELGHDLQGPLNLFRLVADRAAAGERLDAEDVALLREELDRLTGLGARLRRLALQPLVRQLWAPSAVVRQALSPAARSARPPLELELPASERCAINCDASLLARGLGELLDNALAARRHRAGIRFALGDEAGFCVWDDGPGFASADETALAWGATNKPGAAGLGLTVALRAARAHGFSLNIRRHQGLTEVLVSMPPHELRADVPELST